MEMYVPAHAVIRLKMPIIVVPSFEKKKKTCMVFIFEGCKSHWISIPEFYFDRRQIAAKTIN